MSYDTKVSAPDQERLKRLARAASKALADESATATEAVFALALSLASATRASDAFLPDVLQLVTSMHRSMMTHDRIAAPEASIEVVSPEAFASLARKVGV